MATKKAPSRKRAPKKTTKKTTKKAALPRKKSTNREVLENAGVIKYGHFFSPQDSEAIESLSNQEVKVLIDVYNDLGPEMLEKNCPHGIVF